MTSTTAHRVAAALATLCVLVAARPAAAQVLLNINGTFAPGLPEDERRTAYVDFPLMVAVPSTVQIDLVSANTAEYDPYLRLFASGAQIAWNDDGGGSLNARIVQFLQPGLYTVRVTRYGMGQVRMPVGFTLTATQTLAASIPVTPAPFVQLTEALAMSLATQYYYTQSEWAGQYTIAPIRIRLVPSGPSRYLAHIGYNYVCVLSSCGGGYSGYDQRIFYLQQSGSGWQVVQMGPHMSATF